MSITKLQDVVQDIINPVEVDAACEDIRKHLKDALSWVSHPYHVAQRFLVKRDNRTFFYPETYVLNGASKKYHRLTPDNDYSGMFFFMVGAGRHDRDDDGLITYNVAIIFSVNLQKIDPERLNNEYLFTQDLMKDVRKALRSGLLNFDFRYKIALETRDLKEVYREFVLDDLEQYNRAPMQCFRFEINLTIAEDC